MGTFQKGWLPRALISVIRSQEQVEAAIWARNIDLELLIQGESKRAHEQRREGYFERERS